MTNWNELRKQAADYRRSLFDLHDGEGQISAIFQREVIDRDEGRFGACGASDEDVIAFWAKRGVVVP